MHKAGSSLVRQGKNLCKQSSKRSLSTATLPSVQVTTLPNKIRVATELTPGHFSSVGLYIDAGSRYETPETSGVSHFLDRMAFKTTGSRTDAEMSAAVHSLGGQIMCSSSRESIMYQSSHFHKATPTALSLISDTVLDPTFLAEEIEAQRDAALYEVREITSKPDMILPEVLHGVAYGDKGLGNPLLCPEERINSIDELPERMVIAGAGMQHEELVELTDKYFSSLKSGPVLSSSQIKTSPQVPPHLLSPTPPSINKSLTRAASYLFPNAVFDSAISRESTYTGGHRFIADTKQEFNHLYVAFEGVGIHDDDIYALATMQVLLGGGGSFSAGGPGKGMYSRLYTHVLNHFPQVDHCASFHHIYTDSSLFGLFASFVPASSACFFIRPFPDSELSRAKNQLKSSLMMALESRAVEVEDLGRQVLVHNRKVPVTEMTDKIDLVRPEDIRRVAARVFGPKSGNKPTVVCMGHEDTGAWEEVFTKYSVAAP
ncbi:Metalloenzyme, LuxS/M16 peptidase-like protein [Lyophyllum atratum]|nr:Metalloenzyme, LuxS/M16 peptidase-like protein [Lyophyllum atratum]